MKRVMAHAVRVVATQGPIVLGKEGSSSLTLTAAAVKEGKRLAARVVLPTRRGEEKRTTTSGNYQSDVMKRVMAHGCKVGSAQSSTQRTPIGAETGFGSS